MSALKAIAFDVDGTLTPLNSWTALTEALGSSPDNILSIYESYARGCIGESSAKQQLLDLWRQDGTPTKKQLLDIFWSLPIRAEARSLIDWLKARQYDVCIISGSMDIYVSIVAQKLGVSSFFANTMLKFDDDDILVDLDYTLNQSSKKVEQLLEYCATNNLKPTEIMAVGNGANDLELFDYTEHGVLLEEIYSEPLRRRSWKVIHDLNEIKELLALKVSSS